MIELAPAELPHVAEIRGPRHGRHQGERRGRVILLAGCAQQVLRPEINDATIRLLARRGVDVVVAAGAGCCGALEPSHRPRGRGDRASPSATSTPGRKEMAKGAIDAIIVNASGCGTTVKDYGHLLRA